MLRVPITLALPGMVLALPIRSPRRPEHILLQSGYTLEETAIPRLREMRVSAVWIRYPNLDFISKYINPRIVEDQAKIAGQIGVAFDAVMAVAHAELDYSAYRTAVCELLDKLTQDPAAAVFIQEIVGEDEPMLRHSASVSFLSLLMGLKLEGYLVTQRRRLPPKRARDVVGLGLAAMLHDIGMMRLDEETRDRWFRTHDETDPAWRRHVEIGYRLVKGRVDPSAAVAIRDHHQRFDGGGFPMRTDLEGRTLGLRGERIHIFARILSAADIYDRLRHPAGSLTTNAGVRALRAMQAPEIARRLDPVVYKALMAVAPPYPPGTLVTLSNGERGVVTEWSIEDPCRPVVQGIGELESEHKRPRASREFPKYVLRERTDLVITHSEGQEVRDANFFARHPGEFIIGAPDRAIAA